MDALRPWLQAAGVVGLCAAGVFAGLWVAKRRAWPAACFAALALVAAFGAARWAPRLELVAPFAWAMTGRLEFALLGPAAAIALAPPSMRLRFPRQRLLVGVFFVVVAANYSVMPFLWPALSRPRLARLSTKVDADGVCRQTTGYTCGPAAAVTALNQLCIDATESELALAMYTSPALGTAADVLAIALQERYAADGLSCEYRWFDSLDDLPRGTPVLAVVKFSFMVDHFVTVLDVDEANDRVVIADPAAGRLTYTREQFLKRWRSKGVVLHRVLPAPTPATSPG